MATFDPNAPKAKTKRLGFLKDVIRKAQADNEPIVFLVTIGLVSIVFLLCCLGVANGFFHMITDIVGMFGNEAAELSTF